MQRTKDSKDEQVNDYIKELDEFLKEAKLQKTVWTPQKRRFIS